MLSFLVAPLVAAVETALAAAPAGRVAVIGELALMRRLGDRGRDVVLVSTSPRLLKRAGARAIDAEPGALPFGEGELAALVASRRAAPGNLGEALSGWVRMVKDGGVIVLLDRGLATEPSRLALCGGLTDIGQRSAGRTLVTCGRVCRLDAWTPAGPSQP